MTASRRAARLSGVRQSLWSTAWSPRRTGQLIALAAGVFVALGGVHPLPARAGGTGSDLGPNGQHRRPFYIYAHNPNEVDTAADDVGAALGAGANALEPDVMTFGGTTKSPDGTVVDSTAGPSGMFMYHDNTTSTARLPQTLERWLGVDSATDCGDTTGNWRLSVAARIFCDGANVAAIAFDVKSNTAASQSSANGPFDAGLRMHVAVDKFRQTLTGLGVPVSRQPWIIYSVGSADDANHLFQKPAFTSLLTSHEGIMVDGGSDAPDSTTRFLLSKFDDAHVGSAQIGYGAGSILFDSGLAPSVLPNIEQASAQNFGFDQAGIGRPIAIPYAFTVNTASDMNRFIDAGADGEIPDAGLDVPSEAVTVAHMQTLSQIVAQRSDVFLATAADNPFNNQKKEGYALRIHTTNELNAGTDANLTFKLTGCRGSASVTISTGIRQEFERDDVNRVTIPSEDLGALQSLAIHNDGAGTAPGWNFDNVQLAGSTYGIAAGVVPLGSLGSDPGVDGGQDRTIPLTGQGNTNCDATLTGTGQYGGGTTSFTYAGTPPVGVTLTGTATCTTVNGGQAIGTLLPGNYTLDPKNCSGVTGSSAHDSFTPTYHGGTFKVTPRPLVVSADTRFRYYGDANPTTYAPSYSAPPGISPAFVNGDTSASLNGVLSFDTSATTASPPGGYPVRLSGLSSDRYDLTFSDAILQIEAAPLTVTAPSASRVYGADNPTFTPTISGFKNGESLATSGVTGKASCSSTANLASTVAGGPYPITCTVGTLSGGSKYSFGFGVQPFVAGELTITKNTTNTALASSAHPSLYGQSVALTATVANDPGAELATGTVTFTDGATPLGTASLDNDGHGNAVASVTTSALSAGSHSIKATYGGDPNFTGSSDTLTQVVNQAPLSVSVTGSQTYGGSPSFVVAGYDKLVNGDTAAALSGSLTGCTTSVGAAGTAGVHAGTISGCGGLSNANYAITYSDGGFTVKQATLTVTASSPSMVYGGSVPAVTPSYGGFVNGDSAASFSTAPSCGTTATSSSTVAGSPYAASCSGAVDANYAIGYAPGFVNVTPAPLSVTADPKTRFYGQPNPPFTATYNSLVNGDTAASLGGVLSFATSATPASPVGMYLVTPSGLTSSNYAITFKAGTLTIGKAPTTVVPLPARRLFSRFAATLTRTFDGLALGGQPIAFSVSGQTICSAATNASGQATCAPFISVFLGSAGYTASFAGNANYQAGSGDGRFTLLGG